MRRRHSGNLSLNSNIPADQRTRVKLVGIAGAQATSLFEDQDEAQGQTIVLFTPALTDKLLACCSNTMVSAADAAGRQPLSLRGGGRDQARAAQGSPLRLRPGQGSRRHRQRHLAARGHRAGRLRRHRRHRRPPHRGSGDQSPDPPESRRPRHHPGPRGEPRHDLLRRPRSARSARWRSAPSWPGRWPSASRHWRRSGPVRPFLRVEVHADWAVIGLGVAGLLAVARGDRCPGFVASPPGQSTHPEPANPLVTRRRPRRHPRRTAAAGDHRGAVRPRARGGQERRPRAIGDPRRHPRRHRRRGHGHVRVEPRTPWSATRRSTAGTGPTTWTVVVGSATSPDRPRPNFSTQTPSSRVGAASPTRPCSSTA